jgi:hypothetical protein
MKPAGVVVDEPSDATAVDNPSRQLREAGAGTRKRGAEIPGMKQPFA